MADLSDAIKEAYESAPTVTTWPTLEFWHPTFDEPARVVLDHGELLSSDPKPVFGRILTLEADADHNPGEAVTFLAAALDIELPGFEENEPQEMTIGVDNVSGELVPILKRAIGIAQPIDITYREWLANDPTTVQFRLRGLTMRKATANKVRVTGKAHFAALRDRPFGKTYSLEEFPGLDR